MAFKSARSSQRKHKQTIRAERKQTWEQWYIKNVTTPPNLASWNSLNETPLGNQMVGSSVEILPNPPYKEGVPVTITTGVNWQQWLSCLHLLHLKIFWMAKALCISEQEQTANVTPRSVNQPWQSSHTNKSPVWHRNYIMQPKHLLGGITCSRDMSSLKTMPMLQGSLQQGLSGKGITNWEDTLDKAINCT